MIVVKIPFTSLHNLIRLKTIGLSLRLEQLIHIYIAFELDFGHQSAKSTSVLEQCGTKVCGSLSSHWYWS